MDQSEAVLDILNFHDQYTRQTEQNIAKPIPAPRNPPPKPSVPKPQPVAKPIPQPPSVAQTPKDYEEYNDVPQPLPEEKEISLRKY